MSKPLTTTRHGSVLLVSIDDGKANALSTDLIEAIRRAVADAESDSSTAALVIAGRDGVFSGGFDLTVMRSGDRAAIMNLVAEGGELVRILYGASLPIVAACTGHAVAAGALMLLGCDVRIGADGPFKLGLNEVAIGMVLPDWAETIAADRLARPLYHRSVFNARLVDPAESVTAGFLDEVVPPGDVIERALGEAATLSGLDRAAYRGSIERFRSRVLERMAGQISADRSALA